MVIGFTGTREGMSKSQKKLFKESILIINEKERIDEFHHGDCIGADSEAHDLIREHLPDVKIVVHPPKESTLRAFRLGIIRTPKPYLDRNKDIVNEIDLLIASPKELDEVKRSGTWSTIRYAKKNFKPVIILLRVEKEKKQ